MVTNNKKMYSISFPGDEEGSFIFKSFYIENFMPYMDSIVPCKSPEDFLKKYKMPEFSWRESGLDKPLTDHTYCPGFSMVVSEKAKNLLLPYLEKSGAVVPMKIDNLTLYGYKTWITFDSLERHDGVTEFAYNKNRRTHLFVSEEVKNLIEEAGLTGFEFELRTEK